MWKTWVSDAIAPDRFFIVVNKNELHMSGGQLPLIFDGHNDLLLHLSGIDDNDAIRLFLDGKNSGHLDLPRMKQGGFGGGFFAIFVPTPKIKNGNARPCEMIGRKYDIPLPEEISLQKACL